MLNRNFFLIVFSFTVFFMAHVAIAQVPNCDSLVPAFNINFTGPMAGSTWTSPVVTRNGSCCGAIAPDRCIDFIITTDSQTIGICVSYCPYVPNPGSLICQIDCSNPFVMGSMWTGTCVDTGYISVPGIHYITFCKPGNNTLDYCVTSITSPLPTSVAEAELNLSTLSLNLTSPQTFTLEIFSVEGKKISEKNYSLGSGRHQLPVSTENLEGGIYFLRISGEKINRSYKFVK